MKSARLVRRELDVWKLVWQQVETFLDRIDGARDQDDPHRRKLEALLRAAGVVERRRALELGEPSLSDPVVDSLPTQYWDSAAEETKPTSSFDYPVRLGAWAKELRRWRIPGADEVELAVGFLATSDDGNEAVDKVRLPAPQDVFRRRVNGSMEMVRVPSYPGSIVLPGIGDPETADSLFPKDARRDATMDQTGEEHVLAWSALCTMRRSGAGGNDVLHTGFGGQPPPSTGGLAGQALAILDGLRTGTPPQIAAVDLNRLAAAARAAAGAKQADAQVLRDAGEVLDKEGFRQQGLPDELRAGAEYVAASPDDLRELAAAADALRVDVSSSARRERLRQAARAVAPPVTLPPLFRSRVEAGPLRADLDDAAGARIAYPDGTLRVVRALEWAFAATWGPWLRWLSFRNGSVLEPLMARFRRPFTTSVRALVQGGSTGLACEGLTVGQNATVGADTVITAQPASLRATLDDLRPGQVGVAFGDRPAALVLLGLGRVGEQLSLGVSPLRVSTAQGPGTPGVLAAGEPVLSHSPGLSAGELRRGESDDGPASDGLVQETVGLWSRLCLVFGAVTVEQELGGAALPDPSPAPLEDLALFGQVPALATFLVIAGAPEAYWDRTEDEPEPRVARPGEILLLRGWAKPEGDQEGATVQAAMEVERVFRTTGSMLDRMDLGSAARLSTTPLDLDAVGVPKLVCGPEEDVIVVLLRRSWMRRTLVTDITLRRDFAGFDSPSLATERLLPVEVLTHVLGRPESEVVGVPGVDREFEFTAALETLKGWLRFASDE